MKRVLVSALVIALASLFTSSASAGCHHHRAVRLIWVPAPAPMVYQQFQTIGGPGPTTFHDSAPVYGQPITEAVSAPVVEQAAPVVQAVEVPVVESIPVGDTHSVDTIEEGPIATEAVEAVVEAAPEPEYVAPAPVEEVAPAPQVGCVEAAPAAPVFVETPPANRANIIETYYQPQMMYFQPAPVYFIAPSRGCRHCRH